MAALKHPTSKEEAVALMKGPFGPAVRKVAVDYVAPFLWTVPGSDGEIDARNGSAFFINGEHGIVLVTAHHVFREFVAARKDFGTAVKCQICNVPFHPEDCVIDCDEELDIATFGISESEFRHTGKVLMSFQPMCPDVGKGVFFAGFPGRARRRIDVRTIESGIFTGWTVAASVSERQISGHFDRDFQVNIEGQITIPQGYDIGGVSGAPLLTVVQTDLWYWRLGGVMTEFSADLEIFFATRADFLRPDGKLRKL